MIRGAAQVIQIHYDGFAAYHRNILVGRIGSESTDTIVNRRRRTGVVNIDETISRVVRIEGNSQQSSFAAGRKIDSNRGERCRQQHAILNYAQSSSLLTHKDTTVGMDRERSRIG